MFTVLQIGNFILKKILSISNQAKFILLSLMWKTQAMKSLLGQPLLMFSPSPFGIYLNKIGCFCFEKQTLKPNEKQEFVLTFFLDPKVVDDNKTKNISDVTLSFTFFASDFYEKSKI